MSSTFKLFYAKFWRCITMTFVKSFSTNLIALHDILKSHFKIVVSHSVGFFFLLQKLFKKVFLFSWTWLVDIHNFCYNISTKWRLNNKTSTNKHLSKKITFCCNFIYSFLCAGCRWREHFFLWKSINRQRECLKLVYWMYSYCSVDRECKKDYKTNW